MFDRIEKGMYWDRAWKLVEGCTPVSPGCDHCWSARETRIRANNPNGKISTRNRKLTTGSGAFNGTVRLRVDNLELPVNTKKPTAFAVWNDLFHEDVPFRFVDMAFRTMWESSQHIFFVLTKRPQRMLEYMARPPIDGEPRLLPMDHVWLGVTAENQEQADKRIPVLLKTPSVNRYVSIEPMLGPVDIWDWVPSSANDKLPVSLDFVICGGESGTGARPVHPNWARSLRDQCAAAAVPFFFKQWGEWYPTTEYFGASIKPNHKKMMLDSQTLPVSHLMPMARIGKAASGRTLDGREHLEVPA